MRFLLQHGDTIARFGIALILPTLLIAWGRSKRKEPPQDEVEHWEPCAECIPVRAAMFFCKTCRKPLCSKHCIANGLKWQEVVQIGNELYTEWISQ